MLATSCYVDEPAVTSRERVAVPPEGDAESWCLSVSSALRLDCAQPRVLWFARARQTGKGSRRNADLSDHHRGGANMRLPDEATIVSSHVGSLHAIARVAANAGRGRDRAHGVGPPRDMRSGTERGLIRRPAGTAMLSGSAAPRAGLTLRQELRLA